MAFVAERVGHHEVPLDDAGILQVQDPRVLDPGGQAGLVPKALQEGPVGSVVA